MSGVNFSISQTQVHLGGEEAHDVEYPNLHIHIEGRDQGIQEAPAPILTKYPEIKERLCNDDLLVGITEPEMMEHVRKGEELARILSQDPLDRVALASKNTKESVVDLCWFLTSMAAKTNEHFVSGVFRIEDPHHNFHDFLANCQDETGGSYARPSTHYSEDPVVKRHQKGLDVEHLRNKMPAAKGTILFSIKSDGTTFVKPEDHGFPPVNTKGHRWSNFKISLGHTADFFKYCFGCTARSTLEPRRENISKTLQKAYPVAMYGGNKNHTARRISQTVAPCFISTSQKNLTNDVQNGLKHGLTMMDQNLKNRRSSLVDASRQLHEKHYIKPVSSFQENEIGPEQITIEQEHKTQQENISVQEHNISDQELIARNRSKSAFVHPQEIVQNEILANEDLQKQRSQLHQDTIILQRQQTLPNLTDNKKTHLDKQIRANLANIQRIDSLLGKIAPKLAHDAAKQYEGERKGAEVVLPAFKKFFDEMDAAPVPAQ